MSDEKKRDSLAEFVADAYGLTLDEAAELVLSPAWKLVEKVCIHRKVVLADGFEDITEERNLRRIQGQMFEIRAWLELSGKLLEKK